MTRHFTTEHDPEIARLYLAGQTSVEIGKRFGVSTTPILRSLRRSGVPIRVGGPQSALDDSPEGRARIIAAYETGEGIRSLAKRLRVSDQELNRILDEEGIPRRRGGSVRMFDDQTMKMIADAYRAGATTTQLAEQYDTSHITIRNYLLRAGVTLRAGGSRFWTEELKAEAARRYLAGESQQQIGDSIGVDQTGVSNILRALGVPMRGPNRRRENNHAWKGGRGVDSNGYVRVLPPPEAADLVTPLQNGYVLEHRLVMAQKLGRRLRRDETVHHINGDKQDNRPENLQLRQGNHGNGVRIGCLDCGSSNVGHLSL